MSCYLSSIVRIIVLLLSVNHCWNHWNVSRETFSVKHLFNNQKRSQAPLWKFCPAESNIKKSVNMYFYQIFLYYVLFLFCHCIFVVCIFSLLWKWIIYHFLFLFNCCFGVFGWIFSFFGSFTYFFIITIKNRIFYLRMPFTKT